MRNRTSDLQIPTLMLYYWVTETLLWAQLLQGPHVRCIQQSRIARVESISKGKSKSIISPHTFDWSFQYKTTVSLWVWFFQSQYGQRYQYFWFLTHPSVKKGDTAMCMPNVHGHAQFTNWKWFSMVCTVIDNDIHYHRGQNLLQNLLMRPSQVNQQKLLSTVMTNIIV